MFCEEEAKFEVSFWLCYVRERRGSDENVFILKKKNVIIFLMRGVWRLRKWRVIIHEKQFK